jgi:hypothetical protein
MINKAGIEKKKTRWDRKVGHEPEMRRHGIVEDEQGSRVDEKSFISAHLPTQVLNRNK